MEFVGVTVLLFLAAGILVPSIYFTVKKDKARKARWEEIAEKRGGSCYNLQGVKSAHTWGMDVEVGEARVFLDVYTVDKTTYTRARARYPLAVGPKYRVYKEGLMSSFGKALGTQDVYLGVDHDFDDLFMVKCDEPEIMKQVWTTEAMELMRVFFDNCRVDSDEGMVKLMGFGAWTDEHKINTALDLVGILANADLFGHAALAALPGAIYRPVSGTWEEREPATCHLEIRGVTVTLGPIPVKGKARTRASVIPGEELAPFTTPLDPATGLAALEPYLDFSPRIDRLAGCRLQARPGLLTLDWPGIERSMVNLREGAELIASMASAGSKRAYR